MSRLPLPRPAPARATALTLVALLSACGTPSQPEGGTPQPEEPVLLPVQAQGTAETLELGTWNLEWFGDPGNGPDDEEGQMERAAWVLSGLDVDLWAVQEVVDRSAFRALVDRLPGYAGLLADDPSVVDGPAYYRDFAGNELKVGLLYRSDLARVDSARVILTGQDHAFAGRPPVEVRLTVDRGGAEEVLYLVLLHAKAGAEADDRARREAGARALKDYLDRVRPRDRVVVVGDFNDDVDASITPGAATPYLAFVQDPASYRFLTAGLSEQGVSSTVFYPDVIDHQLATDEMAADYVDGSAAAVRADQWVPAYGETTSDHYPVVTRFRTGG